MTYDAVGVTGASKQAIWQLFMCNIPIKVERPTVKFVGNKCRSVKLFSCIQEFASQNKACAGNAQ